MLPIIDAHDVHSLDQKTIEHSNISSTQLMEQVAQVLFDAIRSLYPHTQHFVVFAGIGNNGGDGLSVARQLLAAGCVVDVFLVEHAKQASADNQGMQQRLHTQGGYLSIIKKSPFCMPPHTNTQTVIIDALLGIGTTRAITGVLEQLVQQINESALDVISLDMPSGLPTEPQQWYAPHTSIQATHTLTIQAPKLSLLHPLTAASAGQLHCIDAGIPLAYLAETQKRFYCITEQTVATLVQPRVPQSHKGSYGHACIIGGAQGTVGAAMLASLACLRTGAGLVTSCVPNCACVPMHLYAPEIMTQTCGETAIAHIPHDIEKYSAFGVGVGMGQAQTTVAALHNLLKRIQVPLVLDADALNMFAKNPCALPVNTLLTPHKKEFMRLVGDEIDMHQLLPTLQTYAQKHQTIIVYKGRYSIITTATGEVFFNTSGNAGMATAGSGDVLTGMLTALLSQGYNPQQAAIIGVFLHGAAGDLAAKQQGKHALIASDVIAHIGKAYQALGTNIFGL